MKNLVSSGQLSFANGGYVMHDEASTHFIGMIDQTTLGHTFLKEVFDFIPRSGWQLDPFGHSATQASLLSRRAGFDSLYFGRIDYQDHKWRYEARECEGVWKTDADLYGGVFWGLTGSYMYNYQGPPGFRFEYKKRDDAIDGDEPVDETNALQRAEEFLKLVVEQGKRTKGNHVMVTMGGDFEYENAFLNFASLDALIGTLQNNTFAPELIRPYTSIRAFYSTPDMYTKSKVDQVWTVKSDDFFPYADCPTCYWTGYFTSRPGLKRMERFSSAFLQMSRQMESIDFNYRKTRLSRLNEASAIVQHHDAVAGTSKQHVAYDYAKMLSEGLHDAKDYVGDVLADLLGGSEQDKLEYCLNQNETLCDITQTVTAATNQTLYIVVYNALGQAREDLMSVPVSVDATYRINNLHSGTIMKSELFHNSNPSKIEGAAPFVLYFQSGEVPALGAIVYSLEKISSTSSVVKPDSHKVYVKDNLRGAAEKEIILHNNGMNIHLDRYTGFMSAISDEDNIISLKQRWGYYKSFDKNVTASKFTQETSTKQRQLKSMSTGIYRDPVKQNSGAYIFRPSNPDQRLSLMDPNNVLVYKGVLVTEIHTQYSFVTQITRTMSNKKYIDVEYTVGPVPVRNGIGKEVVIQYHSSIQNNNLFYTDSNGRDFMKRQRSYRPTWELNETQPIAGNYYPVNTAIYIEDSNASLGILTDRSQGGSSLSTGAIELMVQRRTLADDDRGVGEPLDETDGGMTHYPPYGNAIRLGNGVIISGKHRISIGQGNDGAAVCRQGMDGMFSPLYLFYGLSPFSKSSISIINGNLPDNVMLLTFQRIYSKENTFLIRFGHQYGVNEHSELSQPVTIDMVNLFKSFHITSVIEKTLTGNQDLRDWEQSRVKWETSDGDKEETSDTHLGDSKDDWSRIELKPMDVRTFEVMMHWIE
eukprot:CAMPEP_0172521468 /NCGR_PEP_ID=MMETSP1066-20121228/292597_1 /TAXON_ID=671091 /ORGANISM="Coscinodiscus wailesii, Strain CCMP2513" /LENGTH=924 /DNA_ID=CAMNT_0013304383 /DNA_START=345 /DNA_END=3119 /DNA_ORIENTATION=+